MEWFRTKGDLLESIGKNRKDNKLVDRMMLRGEVYMEGWMYYIVDKMVRIQQLEEENKRLKSELDKVKSEDKADIPYKVEIPSNVNNDMLDHLALMYVYVEKKNEFMNKVVKSYYDKFSWQYDWEWAVEKVYGMYWYSPDEWENDELEYVRSLIS